MISSKEISISYGIPKNKGKKSKARLNSLNTTKPPREHHEEEELEIDDTTTTTTATNTIPLDLSADLIAKHNKSNRNHHPSTDDHKEHHDHHHHHNDDEVDDDVGSITSEQSFFFHPRNYYGRFKPKNVSRSNMSGGLGVGRGPMASSSGRSIASDFAVMDDLELLPNMDELRMYEKQKQLGTGTDAHVYEVVDRRDKSHVAMKLTKRKSGRYRTEIHLLHQLRTCPFVVKLLKVLEDQSVYVLILEQAPMTLEMLLHERCTEKPMAEAVGREIFGDLLKGIRAIHNLGFVHKDLKPENVLIFADRIHRKLTAKIADFGFATRAQPPAAIRTIATAAATASGHGHAAHSQQHTVCHLLSLSISLSVWSHGVR